MATRPPTGPIRASTDDPIIPRLDVAAFPTGGLSSRPVPVCRIDDASEVSREPQAYMIWTDRAGASAHRQITGLGATPCDPNDLLVAGRVMKHPHRR